MAIICTTALVTLAATDFAGLVQFYQNFLGSEPIVCQPNRYAEFQLPQLRLGIFRPRSWDLSVAAPEVTTALSVSRMAICLEVTDLAVAIAHLAHLGYPPPGEILTASHGQEVYAYDPEGNWLILHQSAMAPAVQQDGQPVP